MADIRTALAPAPAPAPQPTASAAPDPRPFDEAHSARIQAALEQRLSPDEISTRDGQGGQRVSYVEAWRMIDKAQRIFGFNGWSSTVLNMSKEFEEKNASTGRFSVGYTCMVRVTLRDGTFHDDVGFGSTVNERDRGKGIENARKEAVSDGMKRSRAEPDVAVILRPETLVQCQECSIVGRQHDSDDDQSCNRGICYRELGTFEIEKVAFTPKRVTFINN